MKSVKSVKLAPKMAIKTKGSRLRRLAVALDAMQGENRLVDHWLAVIYIDLVCTADKIDALRRRDWVAAGVKPPKTAGRRARSTTAPRPARRRWPSWATAAHGIERLKVSAYGQVTCDLRNRVRELEALVGRVQIGCVESYIRALPWTSDAIDDEKTLVAGNLRGFASWVRGEREEAVGGVVAPPEEP